MIRGFGLGDFGADVTPVTVRNTYTDLREE
jgi:hypothetical protein